MVKIIETNLSMTDMIVIDHQNRVIEASSWEDYCNAFENYSGDTVEFKSLTSMFGSTIPSEKERINNQEVISMEFKTSKRIDKWVENHRKQGCVSHATAGEQFVYEFLPSGIVECQTVKCLCCGKDFTEYAD